MQLAHKTSYASVHKTPLPFAPYTTCHKHCKHVCLDRRHLSQATVYDKTSRHRRPTGAAARTQENFSSSQQHRRVFPISVLVPFCPSRYVEILVSFETGELSKVSVLLSMQFQLQILPSSSFISRPQVLGAVQVRCSQHSVYFPSGWTKYSQHCPRHQPLRRCSDICSLVCKA